MQVYYNAVLLIHLSLASTVLSLMVNMNHYLRNASTVLSLMVNMNHYLRNALLPLEHGHVPQLPALLSGQIFETTGTNPNILARYEL